MGDTEKAYRCVREKLAASHVRQKDYYDKKVHGRPFAVGDFVWLHSVVIPKGKSKKLHHSWTGPYRVLTKLSDSDYRVKKLTGNKRVQVVHFNSLKLCTPGTRFPVDNPMITESTKSDRAPQSQHDTPTCFGTNMELLDCDDDDADEPDGGPQAPPQPPYPRRNRAAPDRFGTYIRH